MQYFFVFFFLAILQYNMPIHVCPQKKKTKNTMVAKTRTSKKFHFGFIIQIKYEKKDV